MADKKFDAIIIGTGQAGPPMAAYLSQQGHTVALLEGASLGGSCVNFGCTPTKTLRKTARVAHIARRAADFGVSTGEVTVDFQAAMVRKDEVVNKSRSGLKESIEGMEHVELFREWGAFDGRDGDSFRVTASDDVLIAPRVFINTGTRPTIPPIEGIEQVDYLTNITFMDLRELPEHMIIIGGSYIGLELGQMLRRMGSEVTIVEASPHITSREDDDVVERVEKLMQHEGIRVHTSSKAKSARQADGRIHLTLEDEDGSEQQIEGTHLLIAVGRTPNTDQLNLESIGLKTDKRGNIETDGQLRTEVDGVWALGDINGRGAFTHTSYMDYEIVEANMEGEHRSADNRVMAYAMYIDPPLGHVGMSEKDARKSDKNILMATYPMEDVSRAKEEGETVGLIKILVDADSEQILGATVFGIGGDEIIHVFTNFIATGASYKVMRDALPVHPTVAELMPTILKQLEPLDKSDDADKNKETEQSEQEENA